MKLYHGSNMSVASPVLMKSRQATDFGPGFYCTTNYEQSREFARKVVNWRSGKPIVSVYNIDNERIKGLKYLEFSKPNSEWLHFVVDNRNEQYKGPLYDLVIGPVANDTVFRIVELFESGEIDENEALKRFKVKELYNQYVFKSQIAIELLEFDKIEEVDENSN